jgi:hypothetical protein
VDVRQSAERVRPDLLPDLFYVEHRLAHVHGPVTQDLPLRVVANPLVSPVAASHYAELSLHARSTDRLHFEVMRRVAPALLAVPALAWIATLAVPVLPTACYFTSRNANG